MSEKKVLIVDDNPEIIFVMAEIFEKRKIPFCEFQSPQQAIEYVKAHYMGIELVVTDYNMPGLTGLQMMRQIHHIKEIPYLLVSGAITKIDDSYSKNQIGRIDKPFVEDAIFEAIEQYLPGPITKIGS